MASCDREWNQNSLPGATKPYLISLWLCFLLLPAFQPPGLLSTPVVCLLAPLLRTFALAVLLPSTSFLQTFIWLVLSQYWGLETNTTALASLPWPLFPENDQSQFLLFAIGEVEWIQIAIFLKNTFCPLFFFFYLSSTTSLIVFVNVFTAFFLNPVADLLLD